MSLIYTYQSSKSTKKGKRLAARSKAALQKQNEELEKKYKTTYSNIRVEAVKKIVSPVVTRQPIREVPRYPSLNSTGGSTAPLERKVYTGTLIKGIATMHKSNAIPIIDEQHAIDVAQMRR